MCAALKDGTGLNQRWNREFWTVRVPWHERGHLSTLGSRLSFSHDASCFQCFTCKIALIWYKIKQSPLLLFTSITVLHWRIIFSSFFLFFWILNSRRLLVDPELRWVCSYMCWASMMSKYLASMIWGSTLFLNTEETEFVSHYLFGQE